MTKLSGPAISTCRPWQKPDWTPKKKKKKKKKIYICLYKKEHVAWCLQDRAELHCTPSTVLPDSFFLVRVTPNTVRIVKLGSLTLCLKTLHRMWGYIQSATIIEKRG